MTSRTQQVCLNGIYYFDIQINAQAENKISSYHEGDESCLKEIYSNLTYNKHECKTVQVWYNEIAQNSDQKEYNKQEGEYKIRFRREFHDQYLVNSREEINQKYQENFITFISEKGTQGNLNHLLKLFQNYLFYIHRLYVNQFKQQSQRIAKHHKEFFQYLTLNKMFIRDNN